MKNIFLLTTLFTTIICSATNPTLTSAMKFADVDEARKKLLTEDLFTKSWSQFDIDARVQKRNSSKDELFDLISKQVLEFSEADKVVVTKITNEIDEAIKTLKFNIKLPSEIYFVKTTALEEGGASGYTRQNLIVIKDEILSGPENSLKQLILHELFHIMSRNDANFRRDMYKIIGFTITNTINYPATIKDLRITNPDAPQTDAFITIEKDGKPVDCMMVLYSDQPYNGGLFFKYLNVGFMELTTKGERQALLKNGKPTIYSMNDITGFFEQIGRNTQYILHPEEIMADNFVFAMNDRKRQPTQKIIDEIQKRLRKK